MPKAGGTFTGAVTGITDLTTIGNTILGNAQGDTLNVAAGAIAVGASGNVTIAAPSSGIALAVNGHLHTPVTGPRSQSPHRMTLAHTNTAPSPATQWSELKLEAFFWGPYLATSKWGMARVSSWH
jgi:hypothetical protein